MITRLNTIILLLLSSICTTSGQNMVDRDRDHIMSEMRREKSDFSLQRNSSGNSVNFLKYTNQEETQTVIFHLNDRGICTEVRVIFDKSLYNEKIREMDSLYSRVKKHEWSDRRNRRRYSIVLSDDEWYYTVTINRK